MNYELHKQILFELLKATSEEDVTRIISTRSDFFDEENGCAWIRYGDDGSRPDFNNGGFIKAQTSDSVGAIVEKVTNGIDAVLIKKALESGVNPTSNEAPQSMKEAITRFYGSKYLDLGNLDVKEIQYLAASTVRINAEGTKDQPTISIADFGEGQTPDNFMSTFLSLGGNTKMKIKFVQGVYNQGGSAALQFCGDKNYQLILSRRAPTISGYDESPFWGFTLVRSRYEEGNKSDWYEYCAIRTVDGLRIPRIPYEPLNILPNGEPFESGSYVRLYSYQLKEPTFITGQRSGQLAREINKKLFSLALPIEINESRNDLPGWEKGKNDITRIYGFWQLINKRADRKHLIKERILLNAELGIFGRRAIDIIILNDRCREMEKHKDIQKYKKQKEKIFLTVNGQTHHNETDSFIKTKCLLPDLADYMIAHIDLSNADWQAYKTLNTARTGPVETRDWELFHNRLITSIKGDERLQELDEQYRNRKIDNVQPEDKDLDKYIAKLVKDNPFWAELLQTGDKIPTKKPNGPKKEFIGEDIPTYLKVSGEELKYVPYNRYTLLKLETDASNDFLTRSEKHGEIKWSDTNLVQISQYSLNNGVLPFRIDISVEAAIGSQEEVIFELTRPNIGPLKVSVNFVIVDRVERHNKKSGSPRVPQSAMIDKPELKKVTKDNWAEMGQDGNDWNEHDIAKVDQTQKGLIVYVNVDSKILTDYPNRNPKYNNGDAIRGLKKYYLAATYLHAIALFFELEYKPELREEFLPIVMKAMSKNLLNIAFPSNRSEPDITD